jgi:nitrate/nitrite transport system ATP-binding protein
LPCRQAASPSNDAYQPLVELKNVCKSYGAASILKNINLSIKEGEFIAIVGFSGSGKTTLISTIAGLIQADSGSAKQGRQLPSRGRSRRGVQNYSLMPWLTVFENGAGGRSDFKLACRATQSAYRKIRQNG